MPDQTLLTLFNETRAKTLWLTDCEPAAALWTPPGTRNSITWHAGHTFCVVEQLVQAALRGSSEVPREIPAGWWEAFSWESSPGPEQPLPPLADIRGALIEQRDRLRAVLTEVDEAQLAAPLPLPEWGPIASVRRWFVHALHDESGHGGEIWLLRKLFARQR